MKVDRAMLILLNVLPAMNMLPIPTPKNVSRLSDLVKPKEGRFAPGFYSLLQNTLMAESPQQSNGTAFGKLIDKSGTMSGGG